MVDLHNGDGFIYCNEDSVSNDDDPWVDNFEEDSKEGPIFEDDDIQIVKPKPGDEISSTKLGTVLDVNGFSKYYMNASRLRGFLKDSKGNGLSDKVVSIYFSNKIYNKTTDAFGAFGLGINLKPGNYSFTIKFAGDSKYLPSSKKITVKVFTMPTSIIASDVVKYYKNGTQLIARLMDGNNKPLADKTMTVSIASGTYNKTTDPNGYIKVNINFNPRVCNATISFSLNGYKSSLKIVKITVKDMPTSIISDNVNKFYKNGTKWTARLLDAHGNPLANKTLTFNVCGDSYDKTTDDNGWANLSINFKSRQVIGTVSFREKYYISSNKTVAINVFAHNVYFADISDNISSGAKFYFRLLNDGKSFPNQKVTIKLNGAFSNVTTNSNGVGSVKVNLGAGYWPVSLYYNGNDYNSSAEGHGYLTVIYDKKNYSISNIVNAALGLNRLVNANHALPSSVNVSNDSISIYEFSYLMAKAIKNIKENQTGNIRLPYIYKGSSSRSSFLDNLNIYSYMVLIDNIIVFAQSNSFMPYNVTMAGEVIGFKDYTIRFSKVLSFYKSSGVLPDYWLYDVLKQYHSGMSYFATGINEHYDGEKISSYLVGSGECEITPEIRNQVNSLVGGVDSIELKAEIIFNYVRDNIDYHYYEGSMYGANNTLALAYGNAIDQTSLLISMFRAINVPSRYNLAENVSFYSGIIRSHCWAQVLIGNVWHIADTSSHYNVFGSTYNCDLKHMTKLKQGNLWNNLREVNINKENVTNESALIQDISFNGSYDFHNTYENSTPVPSAATYSSSMPLNTNISYKLLSSAYGSSQVQIGLSDSNGLGLENKTINVTVDDRTYNCTTDLWGFSYLNMILIPGDHNISCNYGGNSFYKPSTVKGTIKISEMGAKIRLLSNVIDFGDYLHFVVVDDDNCGIFNATLKVNVNGTVYTLTSDALGNAILNKTLVKGIYPINASLCSDFYSSPDYNFTLAVKDKTQLSAKDVICHSGEENLTTSLMSSNNPLNGRKVYYKILNSDYDMVKEGNMNTINGTVRVPTDGLSNGRYYVLYSFNGDSIYLPSCTTSYLYIVNNNKIRTSMYSENQIIHRKGDKLDFYLLDSLGNPLDGRNVKISFKGAKGIKSYNKVTDENGHVHLGINLAFGNYTFYSEFAGDEKYEKVGIFTKAIVSYSPDIIYQVNITTKDHDYVDKKNLLIPFGWQIGIYKNNKLYKFSYSYASSGMTKLNDNVYYFFSLENNDTSPKTIENTTPIKESGFLLYGDGSNVIIRFLSYKNECVSSFSTIYDGKKYGNINISNVTLLSNNRRVASFYFSSEIFTDETKNYLKSKLNRNYDSYKIYVPITSYFAIVKETFEVLKPFSSGKSGFSEHLCYGDMSYNNILKNAHWSQSLAYEAIETYLINNGQITDKDILNNYIINYSKYSGAEKLAYECLLMNLAYDMLCDSLMNELSDKYNVMCTKGLLSGTNIGVDGRTFDNPINSKYFLTDTYASRLMLNEYSLKASLLEQYVMSLTGYNSTCAVSEILKALFNGENLSCYYENDNFILSLMDNSSYLNYSAMGGFASIISNSVRDNYLNGGVGLESYNFNQTSPFVNNLNELLSTAFTPTTILGPIIGKIVEDTIGSSEEGKLILKYFSTFVASELGTYLIYAGIGLMFASPITIVSVGAGISLSLGGIILVCWANGLLEQPNNSTRLIFSVMDIVSGGIGELITGIKIGNKFTGGSIVRFAIGNPSEEMFNIVLSIKISIFNLIVLDSLKQIYSHYINN